MSTQIYGGIQISYFEDCSSGTNSPTETTKNTEMQFKIVGKKVGRFKINRFKVAGDMIHN